MAQWLRLCSPNTGGQGLVPRQGIRSHMLQLLKPMHSRACALQQENHRSEQLAHHNVQPPLTGTRESLHVNGADTLKYEWQHTPVFLPGESHGQGSLAGYGP